MIKRLVNYIHMTGYSDSVAKNTCPPSRCNSKSKGTSLIISFMKWEPIRFCSKLMSLCRYCFLSPWFLSRSYFPTCASLSNLLTLPPKDKWDKSQGACRLSDSSHPDWHTLTSSKRPTWDAVFQTAVLIISKWKFPHSSHLEPFLFFQLMLYTAVQSLSHTGTQHHSRRNAWD